MIKKSLMLIPNNMKTAIYKIGIAVLAFTVISAQAYSVFAQDNQAVDKPQGSFCVNVETTTGKISQKILDKEAKINEIKTARLDKLAQKQAERDTKLEETRAKWDANRQTLYTKLEEKAKTDDQKQAVANYKATVESAVTARRALVDDAISTFRSDVKQAIEDKTAVNTDAIEAFKNAVDSAITKAKSDCAGGVLPQTVRQELTSAIKAARETLKSEVQAKGELGKAIQALIETKKQAVEKAVSDFKATEESARQELKQAFGEE